MGDDCRRAPPQHPSPTPPEVALKDCAEGLRSQWAELECYTDQQSVHLGAQEESRKWK